MNRVAYYDFIEEKLHTLANRISSAGKLNVLGLHAHSENFYLHFFNLLYGYELDLCIDILVVDAFIRCKIFENPENYSYVATR